MRRGRRRRSGIRLSYPLRQQSSRWRREAFFAFLTAYTNVKRKKLLELLVLAPYIIPSYIITLSWSSPAAMSAVIVFIVFFVYSRVALVKKKDEEDAKRPKAQLDQCSYI